MNEQEQRIRAKALEFLEGQHIHDQPFHDAIRGYLLEMPVSRVGMPYCRACESALCPWGHCHEVEHEFAFLAPHCPLAVETRGQSPCVAWSWAYIFLRQAEKAVR